MSSLIDSQRLSWIKLCLRGECVRLDVDMEPAQARATLRGATSSSAADFVDSVFPDDRRKPLAGRVSDDGALLRLPDRVRSPWWLVAPVFVGGVSTDSSDRVLLTGKLRARRLTLIGIHLVAAAIAFLLDVPLAAGALVAIYWAEVVLALPRQGELLLARIRAVLRA